MESASQIAQAIMELPERSRGVSIQIFGEWFGRPGDNVHKIIGANADEQLLILRFNNGEKLTIWNPSGYSKLYNIRIANADRVRWEWDLLCYDYRKKKRKIHVTRTDGTKNRRPRGERRPHPCYLEPAVQLNRG